MNQVVQTVLLLWHSLLAGKFYMAQPEDTYRSFTELCVNAGFEVESHYVVTEDHFVNQMFRVHDRQWRAKGFKGTVLLLHGFSDSSDNFVINTKDRAPAFVLASQGYDVYLANFRGNYYSLSHQYLDSKVDIRYWENATLYKQALYDIPAFVKSILDLNGISNLTVISHSFGSVQMAVSLSYLQDFYKGKVNLWILLGAQVTPAPLAPAVSNLIFVQQLFRPVRILLNEFQVAPQGGFVQQFVLFMSQYLHPLAMLVYANSHSTFKYDDVSRW